MTRLGLIARCDNGGLGNQTWEAFRHLEPDRTLVVHADHQTRGACAPERYPGARFIPRAPEPADIATFVDGLDVVFSCETVYSPHFVRIAREHGCEVVVQANPEFWDGEAAGARVVLPTAWEEERFPAGTPLLPVPVALDRFEPRGLGGLPPTFYHPASPAMGDRNGTALVLAALRHVTAQIRVIVRGYRPRGLIASRTTQGMPENVELIELSTSPRPYWECYPPDMDVLLLPRRYGGLCLPLQEAAAMGCGAIMLDTPPVAGLAHVVAVECRPGEPLRMKGGQFDTVTCDPRELAATIDAVATAHGGRAMAGDLARRWAERHSWDALAPAYRAALAIGPTK